MTELPPHTSAMSGETGQPEADAPAALVPKLAPTGWYPDPAGSQAWRFWDGATWTNHLHPYPTTQLPLPPPKERQTRPATALLGDELSSGNLFVHWFLPAALLFGLAHAVLFAVSTSYFQSAWDWFSYAMHHSSAVVPDPPNQPASIVVASLVGLPLLAVYIVGLVWQFRAAKTARALGISATLSPGLGVAGWFIPIVNFWFPYQAIRDTMAPENPLRRWWLLAWVGRFVMVAIGLLVAALIWKLDVAIWIYSAVEAIQFLGFYIFAFAIVRASAADHARMVAE